MKHVAIFWDFDNTHLTIQEYFGKQESYISDLIEKIFDIYKNDKIRIFRAYADFEKIRRSQSELQKKRITPKHVFSSNSGSDNRKNASDIEMCLDAIEVAITNHEITDYVIITADRDMIPLLHKLHYYGKETHLIYLEESVSEDKLILNFADEKVAIEDLITLVKVDPDELTEEELKEKATQIIEIAEKFFERNKEKSDIFLGKPVYKNEINEKLGYSFDVIEKVIGYCLSNDLLESHTIGKNKVKYTLKKVEALV